MRTALRLILFAAIILAAIIAAASNVPYLTGRVTDNAEILSGPMRKSLTERLKAHEDRTGNQIAVLTIPSLEGESIEGYAEAVFKEWKLGQKGKDNGILVIVAPQDRRMRIEVGYGLEGTLPDSLAGSIIRNIMTPRFKTGDYNGGIEAGVSAIITVLENGNAPAFDSNTGSEPKTVVPVRHRSARYAAHREDPVRRIHLRHHRPVHRGRHHDTRRRMVPLLLPHSFLGHVPHRHCRSFGRAQTAHNLPDRLSRCQAAAQKHRLVQESRRRIFAPKAMPPSAASPSHRGVREVPGVRAVPAARVFPEAAGRRAAAERQGVGSGIKVSSTTYNIYRRPLMKNNDILKKLRIALNLKDTDIIEILKLADFEITKSELSALFRNEDHRNYKECGDQILRRFLNGLIIRNRGEK